MRLLARSSEWKDKNYSLSFVDRKMPLWRRNKAFLSAIPWARTLNFFLLLVLSILPHPAFADWSPLIERLGADGFDGQSVRFLFSRPEVKFEPDPMASKLETLIKNQSPKTAIGPSPKVKAAYKRLLDETVVARAFAYIQENRALLEDISSHYCVPKEIVVAILLVETRLGEHLGGKYAFNTLASMALCTDLETIQPYLSKKPITKKNEDFARTTCRQRADWAYAELKALIRYAETSGFDPLSIPGSIYGAIGLCQFMPSNIFPYGVDADQDGRINLFAKVDALYSIANYLREHAWKCTMDKPSQHRVIFDYNRSNVYVNTVLAVAEKLKDKSRAKQ